MEVFYENTKIPYQCGTPGCYFFFAFQCSRNMSSAPKRTEEVLEFVNFPLSKDTLADHLNAVQLKRLDLARALACNPKLLLLDELAAGLTTGELEAIMELIKKIRDRGITIIIVEHLMKVIRGICERIAVLDYGEKISEGTTAEVMNNPKVIEDYLGSQKISH